MAETLRIASWNMLHDFLADSGGYPKQHERIGGISEELKSIVTPSNFVAFFCELEDAANLDTLTNRLDLRLAGEACTSDEITGGMFGFMVSTNLIDNATVERISLDSNPDDSFVIMDTDFARFIGVHMPHTLLKYARKRQMLSELILKNTSDTAPTFIVGDFNDLFFMPSRRVYSKTQFQEAHTGDRPLFPTRKYRGLHLPRYMPSWNLDAIYFDREKSHLITAGYRHHESSDHPLIWADFLKPIQ